MPADTCGPRSWSWWRWRWRWRWWEWSWDVAIAYSTRSTKIGHQGATPVNMRLKTFTCGFKGHLATPLASFMQSLEGKIRRHLEKSLDILIANHCWQSHSWLLRPKSFLHLSFLPRMPTLPLLIPVPLRMTKGSVVDVLGLVGVSSGLGLVIAQVWISSAKIRRSNVETFAAKFYTTKAWDSLVGLSIFYKKKSAAKSISF